MQLLSALSTLLLAGTAFAVRVSYDRYYDNIDGSTFGVACSNGRNGLVERFPTLGDFPTFPNLGGAQGIVWNSPNCGGCWNLTYEDTSILITAIDHAGEGFNIALSALDELSGGHAVEFGFVDAEAEEVDRSECGL